MNRLWPSAVFAPAVLTCAADGTVGPPPSAAMYSAIAWICWGVNVTGLRSISGPMSLPGMRPVLIWKSTAAAPTPTRLGACDVPCASTPWHDEQLTWNRVLPWAMVWGDTVPGVAADAGLPGVVRAP